MNRLLTILLMAGCAQMVFSQIDFVAIYESLSRSAQLAAEYGVNGYNPNLTSSQVLHFYCAKPSDGIFNEVYFDDPLMSKKLDLNKKIGFITHGWTDNGNSKWMREVAQAWVDNHDTNVCRVDWSIYSMVEYIVASTRNVKLVAGHLSKFIKALHDVYGVSYGAITLIGHSLGGQVCGITGYNLGGQIDRIIGMDPAGPMFTFLINVPLEDQLDRSDAVFVTVVHSNNYVCGVGYSIGDADYYPNAGLPIQPGCTFPFLFGIYDIEIESVMCSHFRSIRFVHLAMYNNPLCLGIKCNTFGNFLSRQCTNTTDSWGVTSNRIEGDFYFWSGPNPKCLNKYWAIE